MSKLRIRVHRWFICRIFGFRVYGNLDEQMESESGGEKKSVVFPVAKIGG